jgi:uncharacterized protein (PEP-CTERM system associated)
MVTTATSPRNDERCARGRLLERALARRAFGISLGPQLVAALGAWLSPPVAAETWLFRPTVGIEETLTNNVNLQPSDVRRGDFVSQIRPGFSVNETGAHSSLTGSVAVPILLYARTGGENNQAYVQANLLGNAELVPRLFFVDGAVNVSQQFLSPFGAQSTDLASATNNRYTSQLYRVSPYIKGDAGNIRYELRDDNVWSLLSNTTSALNDIPFNPQDSYTNHVIGKLERDPLPFGWQVDYDRNDIKFKDQDPQLTELGRLRLLYQPDPPLQVGGSLGYERNDFPFSNYSGMIYGLGYKWRPSPTTASEGYWEHRYFGSSYGLTFDHRTPLSVWTLNVTRGTTSYPQQLAALPAGGVVAPLLDQLFSSRIVDPTERQRVVDQVIRDRGLPGILSGPVTLYTQQLTLQESANATFGLLGARNSVFFNGFYLRTQPIAGSGNPLPPLLAGSNNNEQFGVNVVWNHQLTALVSMGVNASWSRSIPKADLGLPTGEGVGSTNNTAVRAFISAPLSGYTTLYGGARYQVQTSGGAGIEYNEAAVFVGLDYAFR